ncbi:hypothetical protein GCM10023238_08350 [Streptomyces heliomycini]
MVGRKKLHKVVEEDEHTLARTAPVAGRQDDSRTVRTALRGCHVAEQPSHGGKDEKEIANDVTDAQHRSTGSEAATGRLRAVDQGPGRSRR